MTMSERRCSAAGSAARGFRKPLGVPVRAKFRTISTAVGTIGIWYWQRAAGPWLYAYEGQPYRAPTNGGLETAFAAIKTAGKVARSDYGNPKRKSSRTLRFSILERDGFACRYCGRFPPEVVLEVDHLIPVAHGGSNDASNLLTACRDCNAGKSGRPVRIVKSA